MFRCIRYVYSLFRLNRDETDENLERTKQAAKRCGAVGQKLLQLLVSNDGFLTPENRNKLSYVFENNDVHNMADTFGMYREDFGRPLHHDFVVTEDVPVGSGTIGQVYKFYQKDLGIDVAVKVKHPDVDAQATKFARSLLNILWGIECFYTLPFAVLLKEYLVNISLQLDYAQEADTTMKMYDKFKSESHIVIPKIYGHSKRFIIMSYHDGTSFEDIIDERMRKMVSIDIYFFMMASIICYDIIHCDLHRGNWKVSVKSGTYKLIIYDFGLTTSLGSMTKHVSLVMLNNNIMDMAKVMVTSWETEPKWRELAKYVSEIESRSVKVFTDRYELILRKGLLIGIPLNINVLRMLQGGNMCMNVVNCTRDSLNKVLGKHGGNCTEVMLCYNLGLLDKIKKYKELGIVIAQWIDEDPAIKQVYDDWLEDTYGHKDGSIFVDITVDGLVF